MTNQEIFLAVMKEKHKEPVTIKARYLIYSILPSADI